MADAFDLQRFVDAQDAIYSQVLAELRAGRKTSHWMWFVFPQVTGLGHSPMAQRYAIASRAEAVAYLAHALLGPRLCEAVEIVNALEERTARQIFGTPDDMKLRSCLTLFAHVAGAGTPFVACLRKFFGGAGDDATLAFLARLA